MLRAGDHQHERENSSSHLPVVDRGISVNVLEQASFAGRVPKV